MSLKDSVLFGYRTFHVACQMLFRLTGPTVTRISFHRLFTNGVPANLHGALNVHRYYYLSHDASTD